MRGPRTSGVELDAVLYLDDPDDGAEAIPIQRAVDDFESLKGKLPFEDGLYGALTLNREGEEILQRTPDPIIKLVTALMRSLPYVIEGEIESALLSETEHGFLMEPANDKVQLSFFAGHDAFDPDEYLVEAVPMFMLEYGDALIRICEHVVELYKRWDPERFDSDEFAGDLKEILEVGQDAFKSYRLETERGLRH